MIETPTREMEEWEMPPRKRQRSGSPTAEQGQRPLSHDHHRHFDKHTHSPYLENSMKGITATKMLPKTAAPFLAKHIPAQYAPQGGSSRSDESTSRDTNTKFCYRHRPDMLCRRQADEPTMDLLQKDLETLSQEDRQAIVQVWSLFSAAPSKHRDLMLQGVLTQCCFPQLSFLSANVQKLIKIDFLAALPSEVSMRILCFLDTTSLCKAAQVSRKWRQLADDDVVWHRMCEQHIDRKCTKCGWGLPLLDRKRLRATKRQMQLRAAGRGLNEWSPAITPIAEAEEDNGATTQAASDTRPNDNALFKAAIQHRPHIVPRSIDITPKTRPWKDVYRDRFKVGSNWKYGRYNMKILKGHTNGVMCVQILDNILVTGSYDSTIKVWNIDTGEVLRTLTGHTMGIRCLQLDDSKLISGSMDHTLKVWNWRTGECLSTFQGHSKGVIGLHFDSNILVSGSADGTAKVWDFQNKGVCTLRGHTDWVNAVRIDTPSRTVFTASDDFTVKLWDLDTKRCIRTFEGHSAHVQQVVLLPREFELDEEHADAMSEPSSPKSHHTGVSSSFSARELSPVWSHRSPSMTRRASDAYHNTFDCTRPEPPRYMLTSALDNTIRMWEVSTGRMIRAFLGHVEGVWALAADTLRIVSGGEDRMLKIWDPRSEKCERTITGHVGPVTCVSLSDSRMCSGGEDGEVRVYCFNEAQ